MSEQQSHSELTGSLRAAVEGVLAEPISAWEIEQGLAPSLRLADHSKRLRRVVAVISGLAACLLLCALAFVLRPRPAWAEIAEAVAKQNWFHAVGKDLAGKPVQMWYSESQGIYASRFGELAIFVDFPQSMQEWYGVPGAQKDAIYRVPISESNRAGLDYQQANLRIILSGNLRKAFNGVDAQILEHTQHAVTIEGKSREEHQFVILYGGKNDLRSEVTLRVDPATKLPAYWADSTIEPTSGKKFGFICEVEYPDTGPTTIYSLGIPKSIPVIDQIPRGDLKQALDGMARSRQRFDNYRAVVLEFSAKPAPDGKGYESTGICYQVWRKGLKWRVELCHLKPRSDVMPANTTPEAWWNQRVAKSPKIVESICNGTRICSFTPVFAQPRAPDPENPDYLKIVSFKKEIRKLSSKTDPWVNHPVFEMAEYVGYPRVMGEGNPKYTLRLDPHPIGGGQELVTIDAIGSQGKRYDGRRYWLDPARGHLLVKEETLQEPEPRTGTLQSEIVEAAQSPSGRWYPKIWRVVGGTRHGETGEVSDYFNCYYLDFDTQIPDELFEISE